MSAVPTILEDRRPIKSIWFEDEAGSCYRVGSAGVTRIEAYGEPGQGAYVPFFAVWKGDHLAWRVPAHLVSVAYGEAA